MRLQQQCNSSANMCYRRTQKDYKSKRRSIDQWDQTLSKSHHHMSALKEEDASVPLHQLADDQYNDA